MTPNMTMHTGWRAITKRLGLADVKSARRLVLKYHVPVIRFGRRVMMDEAIFRVWIAKIVELREEAAARKKEHEPA